MTKLFHKLALIQSQLRSIPETGFNSFHKYSYATAEDIIGAVRPICSQHGVFISITCTSHQILKDGKAASVVVTLTATDAETGESTTCSMAGYAEDAKSDKSLWKAVTGASKYCIRSFFCLATCDDPENEEASERSTPSTPTPAANGKPPSQPVMNLNGSVPADSVATTKVRSEARPAQAGSQSSPPDDSGTTSLRSEARPAQAGSHQTQSQAQATSPAGNGRAAVGLLEATTSEMTRLGWDVHQGREYLQLTYACRSRKELSEHHLRDFLGHLQSLEAPGARAPVIS